jgi:hypothetical protein
MFRSAYGVTPGRYVDWVKGSPGRGAVWTPRQMELESEALPTMRSPSTPFGVEAPPPLKPASWPEVQGAVEALVEAPGDSELPGGKGQRWEGADHPMSHMGIVEVPDELADK